MKYEIILDTDIELLIKKVNRYLADGWVCQGGISAVVNSKYLTSNHVEYLQAMIKIENSI